MCVLLKSKVSQVLPEHVLETLCELSPLIDHASSLLQEVELWEACQYGLMGQVHYLLTTGVNVNMTTFVSVLHNMNFDSSVVPVLHIQDHESITFATITPTLQSWIEV